MTSFVPCIGCGQQLHITAPTCPKCGAPQATTSSKAASHQGVPKGAATEHLKDIDLDLAGLPVSDVWKHRFALIAQMDGVGPAGGTPLTSSEKRQVNMNWWAFFFGSAYYLYLGMWKKALLIGVLSLMGAFGLAEALSAMGLESMLMASAMVPSAIFTYRANRDYFTKVVLGDNGWF